ncbi:beta-lactamase-like protein [Umbelopsis sp. PMI_123]|nr:beta-lactamase-like protein [Umbelopsis sp. PMI_123]
MTEVLLELPVFARLSQRVWRVLGFNPGKFTLQGTNTYLIGTGSRKLLLDCGEGKEEYLPCLKSSLESLSGAIISDIIISHTHYDHWGGLPSLLSSELNQPQSPIQVHKMIIEDTQSSEFASIHEIPSDIKIVPLQNNQTFKVDGATLRVIHTPGHTTDHCTFYLEEEEAIFTADCILGQGTAVFEDLKEYIDGLQRLVDLNPKRLYPGHGPVIEEGKAKILEYIKHRQDRELQILQVLQSQQSATPMDIVKVLYKDYPESLHGPAAHSVELHLKKLLKDGRANTLEVDQQDMLARLTKQQWSLHKDSSL